MLRYILKRLLQLIPMLLILSLIVFFMVRMIPGDPVKNMLGIDVPQEMVEVERERLGLNDPLPQQYIRFMTELFHGDLGTSIVTGKPVWDELMSRYPNTLILAFGGIVVAAIGGILVGILAAVFHNKFWDNCIMVLSMLAVSTPSFFLALILMLVFTLNLRWFPSMGAITPARMVLPIITLGTQAIGFIARTTRSSVLEVVRQDYIDMARAKGLTENAVIWKHMLKNALIPIVTVVGLNFGTLLGGSVLTESIFSWPGVGRFVVDSISYKDTPAVLGSVVTLAILFTIVNLIVDLLYAFLDPRIKSEYQSSWKRAKKK